MSDQSLTVPAAGWYPDRSDASIIRWWDGQQWTDHTRQIATSSSGPVEQPVSADVFGLTPAQPAAVVGATAATSAPWVAPAQATVPALQHFAAQPAAPSTIPAGWYPDAADRAWQRWWDGRQWTSHTAPAAPAATTYDGPLERPASRPTNTMATLAMIFSIASFGGLVFAPLLLLAIAGIVIGIVAVVRIKKDAPRKARRGQAVAGIVVGGFSLVTTILLVVAAVGVYRQVHHTAQQTAQSDASTSAPEAITFPSTVSELKQKIAESIERSESAAVTTVTCDSAASMVAGSVFECGVVVADGRWTPVRVNINGPVGSEGMAYGLGHGPLMSSGGVTPSTPQYRVDQIEQELRVDLPQSWGSAVGDLTCDPTATTAPGATFGCDVTLVSGVTGSVSITMVNPGGFDVSVTRLPVGIGGPSVGAPDPAGAAESQS